jgi:hypothetical protein
MDFFEVFFVISAVIPFDLTDLIAAFPVLVIFPRDSKREGFIFAGFLSLYLTNFQYPVFLFFRLHITL